MQPDLIFISTANGGIVKEKRIVGVPDLLVEILSPSNPERDLLVKRALYARNGVREYWIVDGETKTLEVNVLVGGRFSPAGCFQSGETLTSPLLPGLAVPVRAVFE